SCWTNNFVRGSDCVYSLVRASFVSGVASSVRGWGMQQAGAPLSGNKTPQTGHFGAAGRVQWIIGVVRPRVGRTRVRLAGHDQPGRRESVEEFFPSAQPEMFGEIGEHQPALSAGSKMFAQPIEEAAEHPTARVVDRAFERRTRLAGQPRWIAHHER